ncbi:MAG: dynamin family protein [Mycobacteriaceae bacterium]
MRTFEDLRIEILQLFGELGDIVQTRSAEEARRRLSAARERLEEARLVVVVCAEFKRGKSSLLNALLEQPDLFPVDSYYATNVIITASYAAEERIKVTLTEGDGRCPFTGDVDVRG